MTAMLQSSRRRRFLFVAAVTLLVLALVLAWSWSRPPPLYLTSSQGSDLPAVAGYVTVDTLIETIDWLLDKPGGYLSNDILPVSVWLDNMPRFELGVLVQARDLARTLRNDYGRARARPAENAELAVAESALNAPYDEYWYVSSALRGELAKRLGQPEVIGELLAGVLLGPSVLSGIFPTFGEWILPSTESRLRDAREALMAYRSTLASLGERDANFVADADNLREWLAVVERRLDDLSQRLAASVSRTGSDSLPAIGVDSESATPAAAESGTRWLEIDDVFFEARGSAWALLQFLAAAEIDFEPDLAERNALPVMRRIRLELEGALAPLRSPVILNGGGYGFTANHSLVLASYLSRAHAAVIELRMLLATP